MGLDDLSCNEKTQAEPADMAMGNCTLESIEDFWLILNCDSDPEILYLDPRTLGTHPP